MDKKIKTRVSDRDILFIVLTIVFGTVLRASLLLVYPVLVLFLFYIFNWRLSINSIYLLFIVLIFWLFSFRNGFYPAYNLISFFYFIPFILLLGASPTHGIDHSTYLRKFIGALTVIAILNNMVGVVQYIIHRNDDSFTGLYGNFTVTQNGLSLINGILFFYYLQLFLQTMKTLHIVLAFFFIICTVMGFYGAGMLMLLVALAIFYFRFTAKSIIRFIIITGLIIIAVYFIMKFISPRTLEYNLNILKKFWTGLTTGEGLPRKLIIFRNYINAYFTHPIDLFFGSGPGTFNSRSAFMAGSPSYFNLEVIKSNDQPFYFANYAYPLWNPTVVRWYDGFMNQPFTSILALAGEYGLIITLLLLGFIFKNIRKVTRLAKKTPSDHYASVAHSLFRFLSVFMVLLILIDNYIEYPEVIALVIVLIKICEGSARQYLKSPPENV